MESWKEMLKGLEEITGGLSFCMKLQEVARSQNVKSVFQPMAMWLRDYRARTTTLHKDIICTSHAYVDNRGVHEKRVFITIFIL